MACHPITWGLRQEAPGSRLRPCLKKTSKLPNRSRFKEENKPITFSKRNAERVKVPPAQTRRHAVLGDTHDTFIGLCGQQPCMLLHSAQDSAHSGACQVGGPLPLFSGCCGCMSDICLCTLSLPAPRVPAPFTSCWWTRVVSERLSQRT